MADPACAALCAEGAAFGRPELLDPAGNHGKFSPHGYVFLEFDGDTLWETYRTPDNIGLLKAEL